MSQLPTIANETLRLVALTHRSYSNENPEASDHNERLEFLGDAVLNFAVSELVYKRYPYLDEAQLTRLRANLVDEQQLSQFASQLGLGALMRLGKGAIKEGGRENPALLSNTFEAYIAAYFLDAGIRPVQKFVIETFMPVADQWVLQAPSSKTENFIDSKGRFQQWSLAEFGIMPEYQIVDTQGPDHAKEFTAQVSVQGTVYGTGKGKRKQDAEKQAAETALRKLGLIN